MELDPVTALSTDEFHILVRLILSCAKFCGARRTSLVHLQRYMEKRKIDGRFYSKAELVELRMEPLAMLCYLRMIRELGGQPE
jgi:hypothetical protein